MMCSATCSATAWPSSLLSRKWRYSVLWFSPASRASSRVPSADSGTPSRPASRSAASIRRRLPSGILSFSDVLLIDAI
jgi:hypothetical protein